LVNRDWKIKLKIIKTSTKWPRTQTRNKKNKDWSRNSNNKESQVVIFQGEERKKEAKKAHKWQTRPPMPTYAARHGRLCSQWHGERVFLDARRRCTRHSKCTGASDAPSSVIHVHVSFFIQKSNCLWADLIIMKKPLWKDIKALSIQF